MANDRIRFERLPRPDRPAREVLFITNMWPDEVRPYYGSFIASQAHSLAAAGVGVDVVYVRGYLGWRTYAEALAAVPREARRRRYDLVHVHYGHTAAVSLGVLQRPLVISFCGEDVLGVPRDFSSDLKWRQSDNTLKSRIEMACFRQLGRIADATITKSVEMEEALPASLRARNHVLPNGVDLERFAPRPRAEARSQLGWDPAEKVMLFLGNPDDPRKNVGLARRAAELVGARVPGARLQIAWAIEPEDVPTYMNAADCLLFASRSEGSPNAIKEAMACAMPIVSTPVGDVPERLGGVEGCFMREPEPEAFADALVQALDVGRAPAAREAVAELSVERIADRLQRIYDQAGAPRRGTTTPEMATA